MVITKLQGGLGNQMFQYAFGRYVSTQINQTLFIDDSIYSQDETALIVKRNYELDIFDLTVKKADIKNVLYFFPSKSNGFLGKSINKVKKKLGNYIVLDENRIENVSLFKSKNLYLQGFWQSENYFKSIESIIRNEFTFKTKISVINSEIIKKEQESNSVSVHIRRTDYVSNQFAFNFLGPCPIEYYYNAIQFFNDCLNSPVYFIFSDDMNWVKEKFSFLKNVHFINHNRNADSFEDMRLMSNCRHHIIANSSFSWWGAWLNKNTDKIIVAPRQWFKSEEDNILSNELIPSSWVRL